MGEIGILLGLGLFPARLFMPAGDGGEWNAECGVRNAEWDYNGLTAALRTVLIMALVEVKFQDSFLFCDACDCKAHVKSSPVGMEDGVRIRQRFWECPECRETGKTAWPVPSEKPLVGSGGTGRSKELVERVAPRSVPVGVGNAAKYAASRRHR